MGDFSQYFPIGSSGSGGSSINSYASFKVTATDNPVGYNATTGLYTNPVDGSVWLETGKPLIDNEVGDSTTRTSAMGDGQPLFIRLK